MKIKEIKAKENAWNIYVVTFTPNWIEKLFGVKEKDVEYKDSGTYYLMGGGTIYVKKNGKETINGSSIARAIDSWRRTW